MIRKIHVFKAGTQTSSGGVTKEFTPDILKEAAESYDPSVHEAPLVIGHAGDSDSVPAFGWVKKLEAKGEDLYADVDFSDAAEELVRNKHYKKVSISFYPDSSPVSPHPGKWNVRHLALLGAAPPAVKGLEGFKFGEVPGETLDFASELTLEKVVDEDLGPSLATEEGPLEILQEKLEEARKELTEENEEGEKAEPKAKTEELEENLEDQGETKSKKAADAESSVAPKSENQQFDEMATKTEELQSIEEDVKDVASEETEVEMAEAATEELETPAESEPEAFAEGEEDEEEKEMADEEEEKPKKKKGGKKAMEGEDEEEPEEMAEPKTEEPQEMACGDKKKKGKGEPVEMAEEAEETPEAEAEPVDHAETGEAPGDSVDPLEELRAELAALKAEKEDLERQFRENQVRVAKDKIRDKVSVLYGEGRLTDAVMPEDDLVAFCEGLEFGTLEFAEGETSASRVLDILARVPKMVEFGEVVSEKVTEEMKFSEMTLHEKALELQKKDDQLEYAEALKKAYDM